jgi:hypothetical protein
MNQISSLSRDFTPYLDILLDLSSIADITANQYRGKELESPITYLTVNLLERVISRSYSLHPLLKSYQSMDGSFAIGLVLRNAAADAMATIYIHSSIGKGNDGELRLFADKMLNDGRSFTKSYFAAVSKAASNEDFKKKVDEIIANITPFDKAKGVISLFREVVTSPIGDGLDEKRKDAAHTATDTYVMFSKLEHFGHESRIIESMDEARLMAIFIHRLFMMPLNLTLLHEILIKLDNSVFIYERQRVALAFLEKVNIRFNEWYLKNGHLLSPGPSDGI